MFIFPLVLGGAILLGSTLALIRMIRSKGMNPALVYVVPLIAIVLGYGLFKAVYRPYGLYELHFKEAIGMEFPEDGEYVFADTWIASNKSPAASSVAVVRLSEAEITRLEDKLISNGYQTTSATMKKLKFVRTHVDHVMPYAGNSELMKAYQVRKVLTVPPDLLQTVESLRKSGTELPTNIVKLRDEMDQPYVRVHGGEDQIDSADYTKYFVGILSDKQSAIVYVLHE